MPANERDIRVSPPSAWTESIDKSLMYSMSFSEYDMLSNPIILLLAVSTTDTDPLAAMNEMCSRHYAPQGILAVCIVIYYILVSSITTPFIYRQPHKSEI